MMKIIKNNYKDLELLQRVLSGEIAEDTPEFIAWLERNDEHLHLFRELKEGICEEQLFDFDEMYRKICHQTGIEFSSYKPDKEKKRNRYIPLKYTAAVAAILVLAGSIIFWNQAKKEEITLVEHVEKGPLSPGSRKAILLLDDGSEIELQSSFEMKKEGAMVINNDTCGLISYLKQKEKQAIPELHTISVPIGGEYELILADGTHVFINSESKLTYPSFFEEGKAAVRQVKLEGEAYFDVAKNGKPFIVETNEVVVHVLGTTFNLSSYSNEKGVATTLVTGSIEVKSKRNNESYQLTPGYQLVFDKQSGEIFQQAVDTDIFTSWTRGVFTFRNQTMEDILSSLSRWYDFAIEYEDQAIRHLRFTGSAEKKRQLEYLLKQIETVTNVKFKKDGNKIVAYR